MANYRLVLSHIDLPQAQVNIYMNDPWVGANTWEIVAPNGWIGTGSGEYEYLPHYNMLVFWQGKAAQKKHKLELFHITYPDDCRVGTKSGTGEYYTPSGESPALQWRRGDIIRPE